MNREVSPEKPLSGCTVMVTRASHQARGLADLLTPLGATVILQPAIEIVETSSWKRFDAAIKRLDTFSRVVLVSSNAAKYFFSRIKSSSCGELTAAILDKIEFAAIGAATADAAVAEGFEVNLVPDRSDSAALADLLEANPTQGRTMVIRANRGSPVLADRLQQAGCLFEQFPVYQSRDVREVPPEVKQQMRQGKIDWTTVTSSAIGGSLLNLFGIDLLKRTRLASISPTTTAALESLGLTVDAEAVDYSMEGLVTAIVAKAKA